MSRFVQALPREDGGKCPTGWYKSGQYCVKQQPGPALAPIVKKIIVIIEILVKIPQLATGATVAIYGVLRPGALPCPCPGQVAYQEGATGRLGGVLGVAMDDRFSPDTGQLQVLEPGSWMSLMSKMRTKDSPFGGMNVA